MLALIRQHDIRPDQVVHVKVGTNHNMPNALIHHRPTTELQAKFSMEFCMAILLLERKGGLDEFTDEIVNRPDVQAMIEKVDFGVHPEAEARRLRQDDHHHRHRLDGRPHDHAAAPTSARAARPIPMSYDEVADKFRECAAYSRWPRTKAEQVVELVRHLEDVKDVRELTGLLSRDVGRAATGRTRVADAADDGKPTNRRARRRPRRVRSALGDRCYRSLTRRGVVHVSGGGRS